MTTHARFVEDPELRFIERLRPRYEDDGFTFSVHPDTTQLPAFLGSYRPDAIARKPGQNLAIEVRQRRNASNELALKEIRRLFDGHSDWQFQVLFVGADAFQSISIPAAAPERIRAQINDVRALTNQGHCRPAFVLAWALLEAALRTRDGETTGHPLGAATMVQTLAMRGYIEPGTEQNLRALIDLRNRIVHGDFSAEPSSADVDFVLSAIDETLTVDWS